MGELDLTNCTLLELCIGRAGGGLRDFRRGTRAAAFIVQWAAVSRDLGRAVEPEDYQAWWRISRATYYREQKVFRELFPELETPQPFADLWERRALAPSATERYPLDGLGLTA